MSEARQIICSECGRYAVPQSGNAWSGYHCPDHPTARVYRIDNDGRVVWR